MYMPKQYQIQCILVQMHKDLFSMFIIHDFEVNIRKCAALFFLVV